MTTTTLRSHRHEALTAFIQQAVDARNLFHMRPEGAVYGCADELIMDLGVRYDGAKECPEELIGPLQQCYDSCLTIAMNDDVDANPRYSYVEGYALPDHTPIPVFHAWLLDKEDGQIIDPTWRYDAVYLGVKMPTPVAAAAALRNRSTGVFESDWMGDFYFVREGWRECIEQE